jgi:hypothetical protein
MTFSLMCSKTETARSFSFSKFSARFAERSQVTSSWDLADRAATGVDQQCRKVREGAVPSPLIDVFYSAAAV